MKKKLNIAIVGAGLGGLTLAILLEKAGYNYTLYEQAPQLARMGAGINIYPNTTKVMKSLGILDQLCAIGNRPESWLNREWDTGRIYFAQLEDEWEEQYGAPHLHLHRGDLQSIMSNAVPAHRIRFGHCLTGLDEKGGSTRLTFADGTTADADIVIGADGVNSVVRDILLGPELPTYSGFVAYRSIFPTKLLGDYKLGSDGAKFWSDDRHPAQEDRHLIMYYLTKVRDEVYFVTGSPDPNFEGLNPVEATNAEMLAHYEGFHEDVIRLIKAAPQISKWPLLVRKPLSLWSRGRIVLLGDACHPMKPHMGQGAGMAIEDAAVLFRCIDGADGDYAGAFDLYRTNRFERTSRVQALSNRNIWMRYPTDPTWCYGYDAMTVPLVSTAATDQQSEHIDTASAA
ncbi:FAD-dependent monooxygenase [Sphingobium sp. H39-3-25]|uniref:FAD-dependent monooxygenase n=1 Tax=Sphingobium arseniciresistens TaxID=3030834 RepID=UPI0023B9356A|nr:FAD-dependent monooxygenase [Sphingobium arseniciresistens]